MIDVRYDGKYCVLLEGHAGQAPCGQDIVCAGASTLLCTLAAYFEKHSNELERYEINMSSGKGVVDVIPTEAFEGSCATAFEFALTGLSSIAELYPSYIRFTPL